MPELSTLMRYCFVPSGVFTTRPVVGLFMRRSVSNKDVFAEGPPRKMTKLL